MSFISLIVKPARRNLRIGVLLIIPVMLLLASLNTPSTVQRVKAGGTPVAIMPLGDSITAAFTGHASYRYWLWHQLLDGGYNVDFVGSQYGVIGGPPLYPDFDQNHEGHYAYTATQVSIQVGSWVSTYQPQIILLHIGTNDIFQGKDNATTINTIGNIIDIIRQNDPNPTILLAQIIPLEGKLAQVRDFNSRIPALAKQKSTHNSRVIVVDQFA